MVGSDTEGLVLIKSDGVGHDAYCRGGTLFPDAPESRLVKELINQMPSQARLTLAGQCPQKVIDLKRATKEVLPYLRTSKKQENWRRTDDKSPSRSAQTN
jgi:hypothetical protein